MGQVDRGHQGSSVNIVISAVVGLVSGVVGTVAVLYVVARRINQKLGPIAQMLGIDLGATNE